jgi:hypothetical protein
MMFKIERQLGGCTKLPHILEGPVHLTHLGSKLVTGLEHTLGVSRHFLTLATPERRTQKLDVTGSLANYLSKRRFKSLLLIVAYRDNRFACRCHVKDKNT